MIPRASFDQLSIVSDLHLGGLPGSQIFDQGPLLEAFIQHLAATGSGACALLLNGDTVDFLAEPDAKYLDPEGAIRKFDRIFKDPAFARVWKALSRFVGTPNRHLILNLGSHDRELMLPWVKDHLLDCIAGSKPVARDRVTFAFEGAGYACQVGSASVLCLHGNEVDPWNVTDYEALRKTACDLIQGRIPADWQPAPGTRLAVDVIQSLKREHAFVSLLQPENESALRILSVIRPDQADKLSPLLGVAGGGPSIRFLAGDDGGETAPAAALLRLEHPSLVTPEKLFAWVEAEFARNTDPLDLVPSRSDAQLGSSPALEFTETLDRAAAWETVKAHMESSFDFDQLDALAGPAFDYVVAGHTHRADSRPRVHGTGSYFNAGTWATQLRLSPELQPAFAQLRSTQSIAELGAMTMVSPTVVTIVRSGSETRGVLEEVSLQDGKISLKAVSGRP